jgi:hypothetical protein
MACYKYRFTFFYLTVSLACENIWSWEGEWKREEVQVDAEKKQ